MYGSTFSPLCDVLEHKNHIFSESLSSGDDNDQDKDITSCDNKYKAKTKATTMTQTTTKQMCFKHTM